MFFFFFTHLLLLVTASYNDREDYCEANCDMLQSKGYCQFTFELDVHASETGYYKVKECGDRVQPTLAMVRGIKYRFDQDHISNWYHPLGFAYKNDGALDDNDELEPGVSPDGGSCAEKERCQHPKYYLRGRFQGSESDDDDDRDNNRRGDKAVWSTIYGDDENEEEDKMGLDVYEPFFQTPRSDWDKVKGKFVMLTLRDDYPLDIFYFCHIHEGMTGRIIQLDHETKRPVNPRPGLPRIPYRYHTVDEFDKMCGTWDTSDFRESKGMCPPGDFLFCDNGHADPRFQDCFYALDCHMQHYMRVDFSSSYFAAFSHQMIPHHQNAVNMAKLLLKSGWEGRGEEDDEIEDMIWSIINGQNAQITFMRNWLKENEHPTSEDAQCGDFVGGDQRIRDDGHGRKYHSSH